MKYTHYLPATGERGTVTEFSTYGLTQKEFEKITGRLVKEFDEHTYEFVGGTTYSITLHTGEEFFFDNDIGSSRGYIFHGEHGGLTQVGRDLPVCAEDSIKTTRVDIKVTEGFDVLTPVAASHDSASIINDIASGLGATFYDDGGQLTVVPYHNIQKATVVEAPYGG